VRPSAEQIDAYRRDGFVVLERFLSDEQIELARDRYPCVFEHKWETGIAPDEVNYVPGETPPNKTRQGRCHERLGHGRQVEDRGPLERPRVSE